MYSEKIKYLSFLWSPEKHIPPIPKDISRWFILQTILQLRVQVISHKSVLFVIFGPIYWKSSGLILVLEHVLKIFQSIPIGRYV